MTRSSSAPFNPPSPATSEPAHEPTSITSPRSLRQLSIFFAGAACFLASTALTRRAIYRRQLRIKPKYYNPNTNPHEHFSPFHDAIQALNLATMNCFSLGIMGVGGALWAFDISGLTEMRSALRGRLGYNSFENVIEDHSETNLDSLETSIIEKRENNTGQSNGQ